MNASFVLLGSFLLSVILFPSCGNTCHHVVIHVIGGSITTAALLCHCMYALTFLVCILVSMGKGDLFDY